MEPQRIAYILVVEGAAKALSLYKLLTLPNRITKIELEVSTKIHKGQYKHLGVQPQLTGSSLATSSHLGAQASRENKIKLSTSYMEKQDS
jgi:hypothetical protein